MANHLALHYATPRDPFIIIGSNVVLNKREAITLCDHLVFGGVRPGLVLLFAGIGRNLSGDSASCRGQFREDNNRLTLKPGCDCIDSSSEQL
jgi:hypothetical protein